MIRATFIMEQHIGHRSYFQNLQRIINQTPDIDPTWVPVTYEQADAVWVRVPFLSPHLRGTLIGRRQVQQALRQRAVGPTAGPDVVLFNTQVPAVLSGRLLRQQPYIICTDITPAQYDQMAFHYEHDADNNKWVKRAKYYINRQVFQGADRVLPWSQWTADSLINEYGVDPARVEVVAPGVDLAAWQPEKELLAQPPRLDSPMRILFVGGDLYRKGGDILLEAFRALPPGLAELVLVTRTRLPPEAGITVYNAMQPNTRELIDLYHTCDLFVLPTKAEAFGIAAIEACAAGLPVLATAVGGLTDILADGQNGFLVPANSPASLTHYLHLLANNPTLRQEMGYAARRRAVACFDARKNAAHIAEILQETVCRRMN